MPLISENETEDLAVSVGPHDLSGSRGGMRLHLHPFAFANSACHAGRTFLHFLKADVLWAGWWGGAGTPPDHRLILDYVDIICNYNIYIYIIAISKAEGFKENTCWLQWKVFKCLFEKIELNQTD